MTDIKFVSIGAILVIAEFLIQKNKFSKEKITAQ
jgi:hypothetical protein